MIRDLSGQVFGRLTVLVRSASVRRTSGRTCSRWLCRCACGREVVKFGHDLARRHTMSCGCLQTEHYHRMNVKHGCARGGQQTTEYKLWAGMIVRCENLRSTSYLRYGARGITVCQRWRESFEAFLSDVGPRPSPSHSLDRIDSSGNYEPGNVRWSDAATQSRNRRGVLAPERVAEIRTLFAAGASLVQVASQFGISRSQAHRIRSGESWSSTL